MPGDRAAYESILRSAGCDRRVISHCSTVCDVALETAGTGTLPDRELLLAGAMLHDIGRSVTHGIGHAQAGADLCRKHGMDERIARIVECHTGAGLTPDECSLLGLAPRDCMPGSVEEKIVANADNMVKGNRKITIEESIGDIFYLPRKVRRRMYRLWCEVRLLCG